MLPFERAVNKDNSVSFQNLALQIEAVRGRGTLAGCPVTVPPHGDGNLTLTHGPHRLGHYTAQGSSLSASQTEPARAVEKTRGGKVKEPTSPRLQIPPRTRESHFPTAPTAAG